MTQSSGRRHMIEYTVKVYGNGTREWCLNGKLHREDGPAIGLYTGSKHWYLNGDRHREDGPAIEFDNGDEHWYLNGKLHREDGPALELYTGSKHWYLDGKRLTEDQFNKAMNPTKELTVSEIEAMLGYKIKVVGP